MGRAHEAGPYFHRQAAAGCLPGRRIVVIAEPDAGHEVTGVADEPGVTEILAGAGLAGGRPARDLGLARGAAEHGLLHPAVHHRDMARLDPPAQLVTEAWGQHFALPGADRG